MRKTVVLLTGVVAAITFGMFPVSALATSGAETTTCVGTAGYDSSGTWSFKAVNPTVQTPVASPSPDTCVNVPEALPDGPVQLISVPGNITLSGTGNLSCGNGTLSGTVGETGGPDDWWTGSWSATFQNGVGTVTGSVTPLVTGGTAAALSGTIIEGDGTGTSASGVGVCNNDQNPSPTAVSLTVS